MGMLLRLIGQIGLIVGLLALMVLGGCRRQPLSEHSVHEALAEKREQYKTDIEQGVQSVPPPIEVSDTQPSPSGNAPNQTPSGSSVPPYEAPPPTVTSTPTPSNTPTTPSNTQVGGVQLDPATGQYGIAPPGAPEGYTIPLDNPNSRPSDGSR
ncbi:MAG: hypothetical protein ABDI19_07660 [Armatimonadota bacterium]